MLGKALEDEDADVRSSAVGALLRIGPGAAEAVPQLIKALKDEDWDVRMGAADVLGILGPAAEDCVPQLITALQDTDCYVRNSVAQALVKIKPEVLRPKKLLPVLAWLDPHEDAHGLMLQLVLSTYSDGENAVSSDSTIATAVLHARSYSQSEDVVRSAVCALPLILESAQLADFQLRGLVQRALRMVPKAVLQCKLHELLLGDNGSAQAPEPAVSVADPSDIQTGLALLSGTGTNDPDTNASLAKPPSPMATRSYGTPPVSPGCSLGDSVQLDLNACPWPHNGSAAASAAGSCLI